MTSTVGRLLGQSRGTIEGTHSAAERLLSTAVRYYATARVRESSLLGRLRYDAPIDPERLYDVDPRRIERTVSWTRISADRKTEEHPLFQQPKYRLAGRVFDGDWDRVDERFRNSTIYQSFRAHFEEEVAWEQTAFYREMLAAIDAGERPWDCHSEAALRRRCEELDRLYDRIATEGYRTQTELHEAGEPSTSPYRLFRVVWAEIGVNVGRDGEWIFQDGRNRLSMARLLGLDTVPVVVLVRHEEWQRTRDRVARGDLSWADLPERLRGHPDLVDLF
jgi:hypothetical protein